MTTAVLTMGTTYRVTYRPTLYGRPIAKVLTVTGVLYPGGPRMTYIFHGPRGGKVLLTPGEIITAEVAT